MKNFVSKIAVVLSVVMIFSSVGATNFISVSGAETSAKVCRSNYPQW